MRTIEKTVYTFEELSDKAKERAREWYRAADTECYWPEFVIDDAKEVASLMGIHIDKVYWSGFSYQGDGACFTGSYRYKKGAVKALKDYCNDGELFRIAQTLQEIQRKQFYKLRATIKHSGHYYYEMCTDIEVYHYDDEYRAINAVEEEIKEALRDFMRWIYKQLESEHDYRNSDEAVDEALINNGYEFDETGRLAS